MSCDKERSRMVSGLQNLKRAPCEKADLRRMTPMSIGHQTGGDKLKLQNEGFR